MKFGLRGKVAVIAAAVLLVATGAIVLVSGYYFGGALKRAQLSRAQSVAQGLAFQMDRILALGLDVHALKGFEQQCAEAVRMNDGVAYTMVVSLDGEILFHSDPAQMHRKVSSVSLLHAIPAHTGEIDDRTQGLSFALTPARDKSGEVRAIVVAASPQSVINAARNEMMRTTLLVGALVVVVGLVLLAAALSHYVNRPLNEVVRAIERFRGDEPGQALRVPTAGGTELAIMVHGVNGLLDRIAARERELLAAKESAESANRAKTGFLAMMSHELRTPMNAVMGMAELLGSTTLTDRQRRYLDSIKSGSAALLRILDDILNFTRVEMGELTVQHAPFALPRLVEKTAALLQETASAKNLTLTVQIDPAVPAFVNGDAGRTRQIIVNLVGNAIKFTDRGGVTVCVARAGGDRIRFSVSDTGVGIDPSFRKDLYRAFAQEDTGYARKYGGTGLGLAIVKRLCDALEGSIDMESTPGKGSTFWFELPLPAAMDEAQVAASAQASEALPTAAEPLTPATTQSSAKRRLLVVEDNRLNQELVEGYLEGSDFEITLANNGLLGVKAFESSAFDAVLMDWQMPEMDGIDATRLIRAFEQKRGGKRTPIIAVTAHAMAGDREECLRAGMDDYLVKPFSMQALFDVLERWTRA